MQTECNPMRDSDLGSGAAAWQKHSGIIISCGGRGVRGSADDRGRAGNGLDWNCGDLGQIGSRVSSLETAAALTMACSILQRKPTGGACHAFSRRRGISSLSEANYNVARNWIRCHRPTSTDILALSPLAPSHPATGSLGEDWERGGLLAHRAFCRMPLGPADATDRWSCPRSKSGCSWSGHIHASARLSVRAANASDI